MTFLIAALIFAQTILLEDKVIYKVKNEVMFLSDFNVVSKKYQAYRCHYPNSALFTHPFKNIFLSNIDGVSSSKLSKKLVLDLLKIEKLLIYAESQELAIDLKSFKKKSKCPDTLSDKEIKNFMSFDLLLETRFSKNGLLLEESIQSLIETIDNQYPHELYI